jgi:hypothetical protein
MAKAVKGIKVDFSEVESQDFSLPNGPYILAVTSVEKKRSESSGNDYLAWEYKVSEGKHKGKKVWDNTSLQPQALWRLRNLLEAMGMEIEDGEMDIDLDELAGELVGVEIENEKYQGKNKARIINFLGVDELEGEAEEAAPTPKTGKGKEEPEPEEEEAAPPPKAKGKAKAKPEPEPEPEPDPAPVVKKKKVKAPEFTVGQKVTFEDDGDEYTGKIVSIEDEIVTVKVGKDEWELELSEITAA